MIFNMNGGGASLNYKVVGSTTEPEKKENTIWVNTETEITSHVFSVIEPTSPVPGMVWFQTGTGSNVAFNALKKNSIEVYPTGCMQYVDDAWAAKTAKTCVNGEWVDWWNGELYSPNNEWESVTGGWTSSGMKPTSDTTTTEKAPTITRTADYILFEQSGASCGLAHTANLVDISNFSKIVVEGEFNRGGSSDSNLALGIYESPLPERYINDAVAYQKATSKNPTTIELDLSEVTDGKYIIGIGMTADGTSAKITNAYMV